jgi:hypothetical protein
VENTELKKHFLATYLSLRRGIAWVAFAFPVLLWAGGHLRAELPLQQSMSAYYHAGGGVMRDVFTGVLVAVGVSLFLYRGFTKLENVALNFAGIFIIGVAMVPMEWECVDSCNEVSAHGILAVLFFLCIAYVCIFRASDTLSLIRDADRARSFKRAYRIMGLAMIASPAVAVLLTLCLQPRSEARSFVFFAETVGVVVFAAYWRVKSREIELSDADRSAVEAKLETPPQRPADAFKDARVRETTPAPRGS